MKNSSKFIIISFVLIISLSLVTEPAAAFKLKDLLPWNWFRIQHHYKSYDYYNRDKPHATTIIAQHPCYDSDNGKKWYTKGTAKKGNKLYNDFCYSEKKVVEYFCDSAGKISNEQHFCVYGCKNGACMFLKHKDGKKRKGVSTRQAKSLIKIHIYLDSDRFRKRVFKPMPIIREFYTNVSSFEIIR